MTHGSQFGIACVIKYYQSTNFDQFLKMADLVAHSFSNFDKFLLKHLELNLEIDFDKKIIFGNVNLELEIKKKGATFLVRALQAYILYRINDVVPVYMYTISITVLYVHC